jgi:RNA polymerase sigma-70 factor, ECF subfamily
VEIETDRAMIQRAVTGDSVAVASLLKAHADRLQRFVCAKMPATLSSAVDPQDVVQDVMFEACRLIRGFRDEGNDCFFRWIATIARHRIAALLRRHREKTLDGNEDDATAKLLEEMAVYRRTPSRSAAAHELMVMVERSLDRLPPDYRTALRCRHIEGLTVTETAVRMNKSNEAVYLLCCRALKAMRTELRSASNFL